MAKKRTLVSKKMGQPSKKIRQRLLEYFFEFPSAAPTVRELAKHTHINRSTAQYYLKCFRREGLISANNQWADNWFNRLQKTNYYVEKISRTGLVDYLEQELGASAIILFGSFRKGESNAGSDIDIFVECARERKLDLKNFEKKMGHPIQLFQYPKITRLPPNLLNNVLNGIKVKGYFTIK